MARQGMRVAPQLLVTGAPASDDPNDESGCIHVELRYDAALRRIAAEQASRRSDGNNETATVEQQTRRPSSAAPVLLLRKEPYLRTAGSRPGSAARRAPLRPAEGVTDEPMNSCAGGETPPQPPAQSRPSSAQHHTARCSSCALAHASAHAPARPQRPGSASSARRGSAVTRTTSVPALQLGRLHGYMDSRVHPDVFAPRSPRIQLLPRPLSAAARAERPSGHAQPMAAAALTAAASTRAAAYLPTKVASAVPEALRKQSWDPIYSGHALPQQAGLRARLGLRAGCGMG